MRLGEEDPFHTPFDAVVMGTGLTECILAAAFARAGRKVLHLDRKTHYGSDWAALTPREFVSWGSRVEEK